MAGKLLADLIHTGAPPTVLAEADPARCVREGPRAVLTASPGRA